MGNKNITRYLAEALFYATAGYIIGTAFLPGPRSSPARASLVEGQPRTIEVYGQRDKKMAVLYETQERSNNFRAKSSPLED